MSVRQGLFGFFVGLSVSSSIFYVHLLDDYRKAIDILNQHEPSLIKVDNLHHKIGDTERRLELKIKDLRSQVAMKRDLDLVAKSVNKDIVI